MSRGMTLLELTVVLAILAIVTSIAVTSMAVVEGEVRNDQTHALIENIERAIVGSATEEVPCFLKDTGRFPKEVGVDPATKLGELFVRPTDCLPFTLKNPTEPELSDLLIGVGWRGPYLKAGSTEGKVYDGYGNSLNYSVSASNGYITAIQSRGSDGLVGPAYTPGSPLKPEHDIPIAPKNLFNETNPTEFFPSVQITLKEKGGSLSTDTELFIIYPDASKPSGYHVKTRTFLAGSEGHHTFLSIPIGTRIIRAVQGTKKYTFRVSIPRGGLTTGCELDLR